MTDLGAGLLLVLVLVVAALSGVAGYSLALGDAPVIERVEYRPAVIQRDGSVIAERVPDPSPTAAPHQIPRGHVEVRRVHVEIQPSAPDCPPCRLDLSLVRDDEGGQRVITSSPDGSITRALDTPIYPALLPTPVRPWAAGVWHDPFNDGFGVWVDRDIWRIRAGASAGHDEVSGWRGDIRIGWTFGG